MPPRRTPLANGTRGDDSASVTSTPKRMTRSRRARQINTSPSSPSLPKDEINTGVGPCDTTQAGAEEEVILDEIVVCAAPKNAKAKDVDPSNQAAASKNSAETPKPLKRPSRTPSISQGGSAFPSPSGRGVPIKKQDFPVGIAADDDGKPDELSDPPTAKKRKVEPKSTKRVTVRKSRSKWENPDEMLTDPNAPLAKANLRELLCSPRAWDILTLKEREKILAKFPDDAEILDSGTANARPDIAALRNNNNFRHDVARYQEGLSKGFHDPEWIQQAQAAHRSREMGFFDEFMATDFEERWGMPMPQQPYAESEMNENGSRQASHTSDGEVNDIHFELKTSEDIKDQGQEKNSTAELQSAGIRHEKSAEVNVRDRNDSFDGTNGNKIENVNHIPEAESKEGDQLPGSNGKQAAPNQVEAVTTQDLPDSGDHKIKDLSREIEVSTIPSLATVTEGTRQQYEEKPLKINAAQEVNSVSVQDVVTPTKTVEGLANGIQAHQNGNAPLEGKATEQQHHDKREA
ncbi:Asx homology domain-containing protein [Xylaria cubensis]|nr:Asx homology domain-containing protein [Xylaria cubensis]